MPLRGLVGLQTMARQVVDAAKAPAGAGQADVFLIHADGDRRPAEQLAVQLQRGWRVDRPASGEAWDEPQVFERMSGCATLLVLLGTEQPEARDVMAVVGLEEGKAVLVLLPGDPRPEVPAPLGELRRVDLRSFDDEHVIADVGGGAEAGCGPRPAAGGRGGRRFHRAADRRAFLAGAGGSFSDGWHSLRRRETDPLGAALGVLAGAHAGHQPPVSNCVLPPFLVDKLGLGRPFRQVAEDADGRREGVDVTEPVLFEIAGRKVFEECLVLGDEVLIGQTALEKTDLHVDCRARRLLPNPDHPHQPVVKVK